MCGNPWPLRAGQPFSWVRPVSCPHSHKASLFETSLLSSSMKRPVCLQPRSWILDSVLASPFSFTAPLSLWSLSLSSVLSKSCYHLKWSQSKTHSAPQICSLSSIWVSAKICFFFFFPWMVIVEFFSVPTGDSNRATKLVVKLASQGPSLATTNLYDFFFLPQLFWRLYDYTALLSQVAIDHDAYIIRVCTRG